jgi:predicted hydrocarbon binding protein
MTMIHDETRSQRIFQLFQLGIEEILGTAETDLIIRQAWAAKNANSPGFLIPAEFLTALEDKFGVQGGLGLALRAGRSGFKFFLKKYGRELNLLSLEYRLQPAQARISQGLVSLAAFFGGDNLPSTLVNLEKAWVLGIGECEFCAGRDDTVPICSFFTGLIQEFMSWSAGGKVFIVKETECRAQGQDRCQFQIEKKPLD